MKLAREACAHPCLEGKELVKSVGQSRDTAETVLAKDTPVQQCGWEAGVKHCHSWRGLLGTTPFVC